MQTKGFTIIETLVAITILMISIAGPLVIVQKSLSAATYARDQVTASFLAQEEIESIKNDRDSQQNFPNWSTTSRACVSTPCVVNIQANGTYSSLGVGTPSKFTKQVVFTPLQNGHEVRVAVTISWNNGTIANSVTLESYMFNIVL